MKILSLNTWGGRLSQHLCAFLHKHDDVDVFCLQEVFSDNPFPEGDAKSEQDLSTQDYRLLDKIKYTLPKHHVYFRPSLKDVYGLAILVHQDFSILAEGEVFVHKTKGYIPDGDLGLHARNISYVTIQKDDQSPITIINMHGLWNGQGKGDSKERIIQSKNILSFIKTLKTDVVLCGDFNLLPETMSIKIFENSGLRNLIREYNVSSTRTSFCKGQDRFCDYVFLSKKIKVKEFNVLPDEVSDHNPLFLELVV